MTLPCAAQQQTETPPAKLIGETFNLPNAFGVAFAEQPVEVALSAAAPVGDSTVLDETGNTVGQVSSDRHHVLLRIGFAEGQYERQLRLAKESAATTALANPVRVERGTWSAAQTKATGTLFPNGIASYFEITNGLCGIRVPATLVENALPGVHLPAPIVGVRYPDGQWAGRPDFRALLIPPKTIAQGVVTREDWKFTGFKSDIVERGPIQTTVRLSISMNNRPDPYVYEITLYAGEKFFKFHQLTGKINDWFLDLNLDKPTPWRPTRWRTGGNQNWDTWWRKQSLPSVPTLPVRSMNHRFSWDKGPGPTAFTSTSPQPYRGEGEGDLFSQDFWAEFGEESDWQMVHLSQNHNNSNAYQWAFGLSGPTMWYPWSDVGNNIYLFDPKSGPAAPVAGLIAGQAHEISGYTYWGNPPGEAGFCEHVPAWLDLAWLDPVGKDYGNIASAKYMENTSYEGVADRTAPLFGIRFAMRVTSGSYFVWLGDNSDILTDINDPKINIDYEGPLWQDYERYTSGVANLRDDLSWSTPWADPTDAGYSIEPEGVRHNIELARKGEYMGDSALIPFWRLKTDAERVAAAEAVIKTLLEDHDIGVRARIRNAQTKDWHIDFREFQWYTFERYVSGILDQLNAYYSLGRKSQGGLLPDEYWDKLKLISAFYFENAFDEDRALLWNPDTNVNHGGGTMTGSANLARTGIILKFPTWPDSMRYADRPVSTINDELKSQIGRWGAQFTSTNYASSAAITPLLADLISLQWLSYKQPKKYPDQFAQYPGLRHYAFYVLNRTGVRDPRYKNRRVPIAVGNGGPGWGQPAAALLASGFRHVDPQLSKWLMWAWVINGKSHWLTPVLPTLLDYTLPTEPYPFPAISSFPGVMTIHRSAGQTPNETGVYITDGNFFNQHREPAESGEVAIDALGKPLVTNTVSYGSPEQRNSLYKNVIGLADPHWDTDSFYSGNLSSGSWGDDRVTAIGGFPDGSYSCSEFSALDPARKGQSWRRHIALIHPDPDLPVIYIRDEMSEPADYMSTFWMQTEGAISVPGGGQITPALKICPYSNGVIPTPAQAPSAVKIPGVLGPGVADFGFTGHDWDKLFPAEYSKPGHDVGPLVDVDVHVVNASPFEAAVGQWRVFDGTDNSGFDDRQYLRVKFHGKEHITIFTPYFHGHRPADLKVERAEDDSVRVSYTNAAGRKRLIVISSIGYRIETDGEVTGRATFPVRMPAKLYPGWKDIAYPGKP